MRRLHRSRVCLGIYLSLVGILYLGGCSSPIEQATADDVTNRAFTFVNGAVFHAALANEPTTLIFLDNANAFMLLSADGSRSATGSNRFGSCILTVASSAYEPGTGPQVNDVMTLDPCEFDSEHSTLTIARGSTTATSAPAVARVVDATASDVKNRSFIFASGAVFHSGLANLTTTLDFNDEGTEFTLTSTNGTASGPVHFGPCVLTVRSSNYRLTNGPLVGTVITLSTCKFNGGNHSLVVSDGTTSVQSI